MKKYSIIRVDGECPKGLGEDMYCKWCGNCGRIYGDTKEQLVRKVAQVIFRRKIKTYGFVLGKEGRKEVFANCLSVAKEIVEFLGVE